MTTTTSSGMFQLQSSRSTLRAAAILGLCAALLVGFVAQASQAPRVSTSVDTIASTGAPGRSA